MDIKNSRRKRDAERSKKTERERERKTGREKKGKERKGEIKER